MWAQFFRKATGYLIRFPGLADFEVSHDGGTIDCWPVEGATTGTLEHLFLNQVMPLALSRAGVLVLHASAIALQECGVAFLGRSGAGKSTLAASFASSGWPFLTDDCLAVELTGDSCDILPSHPSMRLWQDSRAALRQAAAVEGAPVQFSSKARLLAGASIPHCHERRALKHAYLLGDGSAQSIVFDPLSPSEALIELTRNSFLLDVEDQATMALHFDQLSRLVRLPIFFRLDYPRRFDLLGDVMAGIVQHASDTSVEPRRTV